jgi:hypothetical protein
VPSHAFELCISMHRERYCPLLMGPGSNVGILVPDRKDLVARRTGYLREKDLFPCPIEDHPLAGSAASICIGGYCDPKGAGLFCGPFLRKGEVSAYVGLIQNLKDLKDLAASICIGGMDP